MSKKDGYKTVPHDSRTDWVTLRAAAKALGLRLSQVTGWARSGHVTTSKVKGRRFVSLSDCLDYKTKASLHKLHVKTVTRPRKQKPSEPDPVPCEVVPIQVNGTELAGIRIDGQEVIAVQLLEKILGLQPRSLSKRIRRDKWFVEGDDYTVLKGRTMSAIRKGVVGLKPTTSLRTASKLTILTEDGVAKVLMTVRSRVTDILATTLLHSNFMRRAARAVMQGDQEAFARNMTDDATDALAQCRAQLAQQQAKIDNMGRQLLDLGSRVSVTEQDTARHGLTLDRVSTILEHLVNGSRRPEPTSQNSADFLCTMTATEVVKHLSRMVKEPLSEKKVHQMARKIEVREHGGQYYGTGLRGHSERCRINGSYYIWHYSPAMIALIKNYITGGQRDMWDD